MSGRLPSSLCEATASTSQLFPSQPGGVLTLAKLGFGTSQLMGRIGRRQSLRLMEVAFAAGIRHFDTAPLYGLGAAEAMVGKFAANKRADITSPPSSAFALPPGPPGWALQKGVHGWR